jgi:hypothetical protein
LQIKNSNLLQVYINLVGLLENIKKGGGGLFIGSKKSSALKRWFKEKWIDLNRPIKNSKGIAEENLQNQKKNTRLRNGL